MTLRWVHEYNSPAYSRWCAFEAGFGYCASVFRWKSSWWVARHRPPQKDPQRVKSLAEGKKLAEADARGREGKR
jgi:hypothetical protein